MRKNIKYIFSIILALSVLVIPPIYAEGITEPAIKNRQEDTFKDLSPNHWAYNAITSAVQKGYFKGYEDGTFKPSAPVSREEFAVLLSRVSINPAASVATVFPDITGRWGEQGIVNAVNKGFINQSTYLLGFKPTQLITRIEMVRWIASGLGVTNPDYAQAVKDMAETVLPIQEYYKGTVKKSDYGAIGLMMGTGIMNGYDTGLFGGSNTTSRAEVAAILLHMEEVQTKSPEDFPNLIQMRELGTTGTNVEAMGFSYTKSLYSDAIPTFKDIIWNKPFSLGNNAGTMTVHHMIVIDSKDPTSIYYPLFFSKGSNLDRATPDPFTYLVMSMVTIKSNRDEFTESTLFTSRIADELSSFSFKAGDGKKYGYPYREYNAFYDQRFIIKKGEQRTLYTYGQVKPAKSDILTRIVFRTNPQVWIE